MKKVLFIVYLLIQSGFVFGQQYPFWTDSRNNLFISNPAVAGTRKTIDVRANYRYQWAGIAEAPKTAVLSAHGRFYKGKMGAGFFLYQDKLGPQKITSIAGAYAFHLRFEDVEVSLGVNGSYNVNGLDVSKMTYLNSHDPLLINATTYNKAKIANVATGFLMHNDRFYLGLSMNNMLGASYKFRENKNALTHTNLTTVPHYSLGVGYNWAENTDFIFENSLMVNFVIGTPMLIDYNLKMHIKNAFYFGGGIRLKTCVYGQVGYSFKGFGQVGYSYDFNTNGLMRTNSGSHEIKLIYIFDNAAHDRHRGGHGFEKQKFQYMM